MSNPLKTDLKTIFFASELDSVQRDLKKAKEQLKEAENMKGALVTREVTKSVLLERIKQLKRHERTLLKSLE